MNRHFLNRVTTLMAVLGLTVTSLLLVFLLLDQITVGAAPGENITITDARPSNATFTVSGTVTCEATGLGIPDVEVFAWNRGKGTGSTGDYTDSSGHYSATLEGGNYDLIFHPPCDSGCASKVHKGLTGPPDLTLNVVLSPGHTVSGTVYATDGTTPVDDVSIYAFNHDTADGFGLTPTKGGGRYCVGLVEGPYDLGFTPPPCRGLSPKTESITISQDMTLDVTLPPGFTVAGCITDRIGNPVPGVQIYAYDPHIRGFGFAPSDESGCYTGTLPLGTFDIQFIPPAGRGLGSVTVVDMVSETVGCPNTSLPITLPAGFTVSGQATCQGQLVKNVFVYADPVGGGAPGDDLVGWGVYTVDDGSYGLPLVPGTYTLEFIPPPATGLNAKAFTTVELVTDTVLNVDFCVCSGVWVTETVDSAGDVGAHTSLALEPTDPYAPHISYWDATNDSLKYARLSGTAWLSETVDSGGRWTSLALVPTHPDIPCISYLDYQDWDLRYACQHGITWIITTVHSGHRAGMGGISLALEPTDPCTPHISYSNPVADTLYHAYLSGTTWISGTWVIEQIEPSDSDAGGWNSLALESTYPYTPHISYYDDAKDDLKHAWLSGTTWLSETVDSTGQPDWSTGATSLELDQADAPYISYYDAISDDLKLAYFNGTAWIIQTVDSEGDVGSWSSLALDRVGCPCISYYDATNGDLKYACLPPIKLYLPFITKNYLQP